ncbi:CPBP family intramembrane metalloprotease [Lysinibacillus macroides]|uniref:CAAX protease n=1 Tax=Lysinibacillus macroides TaxID=33935 RepID=A0A0M9DHN9_9BACI|nr:CPBP family intramembrane glutamic endopeptidase [Lysinibacillus macroides]KOY80570.1 CAAX protease [Lysinibacillus macroides]QPR69706.1 CPBP family intramembrane metalloprotease [Lysinibacillus macroides]
MMESMISGILQVLLFSVIPFIWWFFTGRKKEPFQAWLGFHKPIITHKGTYFALCLLAIALFIVPIQALVFFYIDSSLLASNQFAGLGWAGIFPALSYAIIQTGLSEELLFRGFLLKRLAKLFGFQVGNILQSLMFGCIHGAMLGSMLPIFVLFLVVLATAFAGYIMGWLNERLSGGSILTSWAIHSMANFLAANMTMFQIL